MSNKKQPTEELSWEEAVARYLQEHPDYFERHVELLEGLRIPHAARGQAVSLIERQVDVLRAKREHLAQQLADLLEMARENDGIAERLHRFAIALIDCGALDDLLDTAQGLLRQEFSLDAVSVLLAVPTGGHARRPEFIDPAEPRFEALWSRCPDRKPLCGAQHDAGLLQFLFHKKAPEIKSAALIPLQGTSWRGVLALGSHDPHRFHAALGTVYLSRLGELLGRSLSARGSADLNA